MLAKLELWIEYQQKERLTYNISSLMHGILMEQIDPAYGEVLHLNGQKPFHQSVSEMGENCFKWTICTLDLEAKKQIIDVLITKKKFYMRHKDLELRVTKWNLSGISYDELIEKYYFQKNSRNIPIRFVTPTAFKSNGRYIFMPDVHFIFQSLINKYNAFASDTSVEGEEILEHFEKYAAIQRYKLKSVRYALEGVWISAFMGELVIHINGPEQMVNLAHMLVAFGEYAGIGIKTSIGMGHIKKGEEENR